MRLEVLADNKGAVIYVLNRPEVYIGSTENNDIVIPAAEVSKKHLKIIITDDKKCFVIDQGSTNGSFINDERLIPGKREELKMFSSIRLGSEVLLTLLDKDRGDLPELPLREQFVEEKKMVIADEDKTRVISLKSLQKVKTEKVRKKRLKTLEAKLKKKKIIRKDKATINQAIITALLIMVGTYAAMKIWDLQKQRKARSTIVGQIKQTQLMIDDEIESYDENVIDLRIPKANRLPVEEITKHVEDVNCLLQEELFFCKRMPRGEKKKNGAVNINGQIVIYLEQKEWLEKAQALVEAYNENNSSLVQKVDDEESKETNELGSIEGLNLIASLSYLKEYLWRPLPQEILTYNLYIVLFSAIGSEIEIKSVLAIRASAVAQVNARYSENFFKSQKFKPLQILKNLDRFYKLY